MKGKSKLTQASIGPLIPIVPFDDFSKIDYKYIEQAWHLTGPTVNHNLNCLNPPPLWTIFCCCYLEGMNHAIGAMQSKLSPANNSPTFEQMLKEET